MTTDFEHVNAPRLAELLQTVTQHQAPADPRAALQELLAMPLEALRDHPRLLTVADILACSDPDPAILESAKNWAKQLHARDDCSPTSQAATAVYYATIAASIVRTETAISSLEATEILTGLDWVRQRNWIDGTIRDLARAAHHELV